MFEGWRMNVLTRKRRRTRWYLRPTLEWLEDRLAPAVAPPFTLMVTRLDDPFADPLRAPEGTLRWAINEANTRPGYNIIRFDIPKMDGDAIIEVNRTRGLPPITDQVFIDGGTKPAGRPDQKIVIQGFNNHPDGTAGLTFGGRGGDQASGSTIVGLLVRDFVKGPGILVDNVDTVQIGGPKARERMTIVSNDTGIRITGARAVRNEIIGCDIGHRSGLDAGNTRYGIHVTGQSAGTLIGRSDPYRNVIAYNKDTGVLVDARSDATIEGNYIGTVTGEHRAPNGWGVVISGQSHAWIGHGLDVARLDIPSNVISGNNRSGVVIEFSRAVVIGNYIGIGADSVTPVANLGPGIHIRQVDRGHGVAIGTETAGNVISGNRSSGIYVLDSTGVEIQGNLIGWVKPPGRALTAEVNAGHGILFSPTSNSNNVKKDNRIRVGMGFFGVQNPGRNVIADPNLIVTDGGLAIDNGPIGVTTDGVPVLTSAVVSGQTTVIQGSLTSAPNASFLIEFFGNSATTTAGYGPGEKFLGDTFVTTNSSGYASFNVTLPNVYGLYASATATGLGAYYYFVR